MLNPGDEGEIGIGGRRAGIDSEVGICLFSNSDAASAKGRLNFCAFQGKAAMRSAPPVEGRIWRSFSPPSAPIRRVREKVPTPVHRVPPKGGSPEGDPVNGRAPRVLFQKEGYRPLPKNTKRDPMGIIVFLLFIAVWILVQVYVLPKMGIST
jgi:hypothetical protein